MKIRTIKTRLRKKDFQRFTDDLATAHWKRCPKGYMICQCEYATMLRELAKLGQRKR